MHEFCTINAHDILTNLIMLSILFIEVELQSEMFSGDNDYEECKCYFPCR